VNHVCDGRMILLLDADGANEELQAFAQVFSQQDGAANPDPGDRDRNRKASEVAIGRPSPMRARTTRSEFAERSLPFHSLDACKVEGNRTRASKTEN